jgi:hypothetical protein
VEAIARIEIDVNGWRDALTCGFAPFDGGGLHHLTGEGYGERDESVGRYAPPDALRKSLEDLCNFVGSLWLPRLWV